MFSSHFSLVKLWGNLILAAIIIIFAAVFAPIDDQNGEGFLRFLGRFHVLVLHFPVVLLLLAPSCDLLSRKKQFQPLQAIVPFLWVIGLVSVLITVSLGLMLAANEGYKAEQVFSHQLGGVSVAVLTIIAFGLKITSNQLTKRWISASYTLVCSILVVMIMVAAHAGGNLVHGEIYLTQHAPDPIKTVFGLHEEPIEIIEVDDAVYNEKVRPIINSYCLDCHGQDKQKGNIRFDTLNPDMINGHDAEKWHAALDMINSGEMPPVKKAQPTNEERRTIVNWMTDNIKAASTAKNKRNAHPIRRLTKEQYTNTLQDLLGNDINFGDILPDDGKSELGFSNDGEILQMTPLHSDYFYDIAKAGLLKTLSLGDKPEVIRYRVTFAKKVAKGNESNEIDGFKEVVLSAKDFKVELLDENGQVRVGKDKVEQAALAKLKMQFSVSLRGSAHNRFEVNKQGIVLASALPHVEKPPYANMGPSPNLKIQVKDIFPHEGKFQLRVTAEKGELDANFFGQLSSLDAQNSLANYDHKSHSLQTGKHDFVINGKQARKTKNFEKVGNFWQPADLKEKKSSVDFNFVAKESGFYQIDLIHPPLTRDIKNKVKLKIDAQTIKASLDEKREQSQVSALGTIFIEKGQHSLSLQANNFIGFSDFVFTQAPDNTKLLKQVKDSQRINAEKYAQYSPSIQPFAGTRLDDGMDYQTFDKTVSLNTESQKPEVYTFTGQLENLPVPTSSNPEEKLSGIAILGLWNNFLVKKDTQAGPPLLVKSVEVEAPYFEQWPTKSHKKIFFDSKNKMGTKLYAQEVISRFAENAFRRPLTDEELTNYLDYWQKLQSDYPRYEDSVVEVLVAVLTSPKFLYLAEEPQRLTAETEDDNEIDEQGNGISDYALASRLSYFLWNSAPDETLLGLAKKGDLSSQLPAQVDRMLEDEKSWRFVRTFANQWLRVDRHESMNVNTDLYPSFSRFVKADMAEETYQFIRELLVKDLSIFNLVDSKFAMLNQNLAEFYGIDNVIGHEFRSVPILPEQHRGGLLSQGAFLSGHSNGKQAHPVKRAIWFKEKILGTPPPAAPPNIPALDPDTPGFENLTLKQQLETHRNKESCRDCHAMIDPYGVAFENFDAVGLYQKFVKGRPVDAVSILPDGVEVNGVDDIKQYVLDKKPALFTQSLVKHLYSYALGREVSFSDEAKLDAIVENVQNNNNTMRSVIKSIVTAPSFNRL